MSEKTPFEFSRRQFLTLTGIAGASLVLPKAVKGQEAPAAAPAAAANTSPNEDIRIGLIGAGSQGRVLMASCLKIPGVRFIAVTDIWEYNRKYASNILKKYKQPVNGYEDYKEMLAKEKLDAVLIATPDFCHAPMTIDCLNAGLDVYCEKEMSNTIEGAKSMVLAQRKTGKLLQIGHQRRSNPRYHHALAMINDAKILGQITAINGQWNRAVQEPLGWPKKYLMDDATLKKYGYENMEQYRNWRWYKKYAGGPIVDLGSHQIDVYNWFLGTTPKTVMAVGGIDYYKDGREWYDNVMVTYEYETPNGNAQAFYQVLNTTSHGNFYETFMGDEGTMVLSEDKNVGHIFREVRAKRRDWEDMSEKVETMGKEAIELKLGESRKAGKASAESLEAEADANKPEHMPHLENFFKTMRGEAELNCPAEESFVCAVTVLKVNEAIAAQKKLVFSPEEFKI